MLDDPELLTQIGMAELLGHGSHNAHLSDASPAKNARCLYPGSSEPAAPDDSRPGVFGANRRNMAELPRCGMPMLAVHDVLLSAGELPQVLEE